MNASTYSQNGHFGKAFQRIKKEFGLLNTDIPRVIKGATSAVTLSRLSRQPGQYVPKRRENRVSLATKLAHEVSLAIRQKQVGKSGLTTVQLKQMEEVFAEEFADCLEKDHEAASSLKEPLQPFRGIEAASLDEVYRFLVSSEGAMFLDRCPDSDCNQIVLSGEGYGLERIQVGEETVCKIVGLTVTGFLILTEDSVNPLEIDFVLVRSVVSTL